MAENGWEMVGVYPNYVLQTGAFLAGGLFSFTAPFHKKNFLDGLYEKTFLFYNNKPTPK